VTPDDLVLDPFEGSEPGFKPISVEKADHPHAWDVVPSPYDRPPKYEQCLVCKKRRPIPKPDVRIFIPTPANDRTGY